MSLRLSLLTTMLLSLLFVALVACGDDDEATPSDKATSTPSGATPTQAAGTTPSLPTYTGTATATVNVAGQTFTFENGRCDVGPDDAWLAVNIGQPGSDEYFRLLVGANPAVGGGARPVKGGGVFTDGDIALSGTRGLNTFLVGGVEGDTVTVEADLKSGDFQGTTVEGQPISGSFKC